MNNNRKKSTNPGTIKALPRQIETRNNESKSLPAQNMPSTSKKTAAYDSLFDFNSKTLVQGIIFSEILGKPKAKRGGRW